MRDLLSNLISIITGKLVSVLLCIRSCTVCPSVYVSVHLSSLWKLICMSAYIFVCLSVFMCLSVSIHLSAYLSMCMCLCVCLLNCMSICLYVYLYMCICIYRKWENIRWAKLSCFSRFSGVPRKVFHEYKCISLIILNNEHLWPRRCKSISVKTLMALKPQIFSSANLFLSTVCV